VINAVQLIAVNVVCNLQYGAQKTCKLVIDVMFLSRYNDKK